MSRLRLRRLAVALLAIAWMGSTAALCLCPLPVAAAASAHGCCDEGPGLAPGDTHCCQDAAPATARVGIVHRGGPAVMTAVDAALAARPATPTAAPLPARPGGRSSSPAVVLRV
jgi:hypothetical protein